MALTVIYVLAFTVEYVLALTVIYVLALTVIYILALTVIYVRLTAKGGRAPPILGPQPVSCGSAPLPQRAEGEQLEENKDLHLKATARIWP